jgi:hypothetical protein
MTKKYHLNMYDKYQQFSYSTYKILTNLTKYNLGKKKE